MTNFTQSAFEGALLADAVYSDGLQNAVDYAKAHPEDTEVVKDKIRGALSNDLSSAEVDYFIDHFEIVQTSFGNSSGYDGMLVKDKGTGQYWLVNRGTELLGLDPIIDIGVAFMGKAVFQISAMESFYSELQTSGKLPVGATLNVAGHSLGGHLTTWFALAHPTAVHQAFTYNGAGVDQMPRTQADSKSFWSKLLGVIADTGTDISSIPATVWHDLENLFNQSGFPNQRGNDHIRNFFTKEGVEVVENTGHIYGEIYPVGTEWPNDSVVNFREHFIANLTHALFVDYELSRIDPSLDMEALGKLTGDWVRRAA